MWAWRINKQTSRGVKDSSHSASTQLITVCLLRRVLVETFSKESRILFQRRGSYFGKSTVASQYYLGKSIAIGLPFTYRLVYIWVEWQICIFWPLTTVLSTLRVSTTKNKVGQWIQIMHLFVLSLIKGKSVFLGRFIICTLTSGCRHRSVALNLLIGSWRKYGSMIGDLGWLIVRSELLVSRRVKMVYIKPVLLFVTRSFTTWPLTLFSFNISSTDCLVDDNFE